MIHGIPTFLLPPEFRQQMMEEEKQLREYRRKKLEKALENAQDWSLSFKWSSMEDGVAAFKADTFKPKPLFDVEPIQVTQNLLKHPHETDIQIPSGKVNEYWVYRNSILPKGESLAIYQGNKRAKVVFDGDVVIPTLLAYNSNRRFNPMAIWMSLTPMEMLTQRPGIKHCTGNVCIGGYGLGWFFEQVIRKKSVKSVTVVEINKKLLDWFARDRMLALAEEAGKSVRIIHGDVYEWLVRTHDEYDKIALDVFPRYGNNNPKSSYRLQRLLHLPEHTSWRPHYRFDPKKLWCWGSASIGRR